MSANLAKDAGVPAGPRSSSEFGLGIPAESQAEVDSLLAEAEAAGGALLAPAHIHPWGFYSGYFAGPDGSTSVPVRVAPLVAPAVDLTVVALLVAIGRLSTQGASGAVVRSARRLLVGASAVTLALNVAEPLIAGEVGKALFDAVGPLLLIGWSEAGPGLLQALAEGHRVVGQRPVLPVVEMGEPSSKLSSTTASRLDRSLVERAKQVDAQHRERYQRPISAEELRKAFGVGAQRSRILTCMVRAEWGGSSNPAVETIA